MRVLITAAGSTTAISAAKALKKSKRHHFIVGTDIYPSTEIAGTIFCDTVHRVPLFSDPQYIETLLSICKKERIEFIIPIMDQEVEIIAANANLFKDAGIMPCVSDVETIRICNDKYLTWKALRAKGIDTPHAYLPEESVLFLPLFPLFIKPRHGISSRDCYKITTKEEYDLFVKKVDQPVIQQYLSGKQYVVDIVCDLASNPIVSTVRHEISAKSGLGVKAVTLHDTVICEYAEKIAKALLITGQANIEVFKDNDTISLIEVNPRLSAGSILSAAAGVNIAEVAIDVFSNKELNREDYRYHDNVYMTRYWEEVYYRDGQHMNF
ncbi:MAG: hypothetical protein RI947_684 [Candidatus Parcubacteria bacterium]|jgi:carbamoyl-phosphate synthase large subunit